MTSIVRRPFLEIHVDGQVVPYVYSARTRHGFDQRVSEAEVVVPLVPDWITYGSVVTVYMGASQATSQLRFGGFLVEIDRDLYPRQATLLCKGLLYRAQIYANKDPLGTDLSNAGAGQTDQAIILQVLGLCGLGAGAPVPVSIGGTGKVFGVTNQDQVRWPSGQDILSLIDSFDTICLGYRTFDTIGAGVAREIVTVVPAASAAATFTEGIDIEQAQAAYSIADAKSTVAVTGYTPAGASGPVNYTATYPNPLLPFDIADQINSPLIEKSLAADAGAGMSCQEVALWAINELDRAIVKPTFTTPRDDLLSPGQTVAIVSPGRLGLQQYLTVQSVQNEITEQGSYAQQLGLIAGVVGTTPAGPGTGGTQSPPGQPGGAGGPGGGGSGNPSSGGGLVGGGSGTGTTPGSGSGGASGGSSLPPRAQFTMTLESEQVLVSGSYATIYIVTCTSTSTGQSAPLTGHAWTATGAHPTAGAGAIFTTSYGTDPGGDTISLLVADGNGQTATISHTVPAASSGQYLQRTLFLAGTSHIEAFDGTAWRSQSIGSVVTSNGPIWGGGSSYYGAPDFLATSPAGLNPLGFAYGYTSDITALWIEAEASPSRLLMGDADGVTAISYDGGSTWTIAPVGLPTFPVIRCVISRQRPSEWFALTPSALYQTEDAGRTWRAVQSASSGETFRDLSVSFSRIMIAMIGGRGLCDAGGTAQTLPGGMSGAIAVAADIRSDRFYVYDNAGNTAYHSSAGGTVLVAGAGLPSGCQPQQRGLWRDSQLAGLLYLAGGSGGAWKSVDGFGSSGGYFLLRQPGVQGAPSAASYAQIGAGGSLVRAPMAAGTTVGSAAGTDKMLYLWTGSANNPAPSGWQQTGFVDSAWAAAILVTGTNTGGATAPSGSQLLWCTAASTPAGARGLLRRAFTLPAGAVASASLRLYVDDQVDGVWINGINVFGPAGTSVDTTIAVPAGLLRAGGTNVIAVSHANIVPPGAFISYRLDVS